MININLEPIPARFGGDVNPARVASQSQGTNKQSFPLNFPAIDLSESLDAEFAWVICCFKQRDHTVLCSLCLMMSQGFVNNET